MQSEGTIKLILRTIVNPEVYISLPLILIWRGVKKRHIDLFSVVRVSGNWKRSSKRVLTHVHKHPMQYDEQIGVYDSSSYPKITLYFEDRIVCHSARVGFSVT